MRPPDRISQGGLGDDQAESQVLLEYSPRRVRERMDYTQKIIRIFTFFATSVEDGFSLEGVLGLAHGYLGSAICLPI